MQEFLVFILMVSTVCIVLGLLDVCRLVGKYDRKVIKLAIISFHVTILFLGLLFMNLDKPKEPKCVISNKDSVSACYIKDIKPTIKGIRVW